MSQLSHTVTRYGKYTDKSQLMNKNWSQCKMSCRFFLILLGILFYSSTPGTARATIITTLSPLAGLVSMLDTKAIVQCLLPPGADPHDFQLTPKQVQQLQQTDLLIRSSRDDGHWAGLGVVTQQFDLWSTKDHAWLLPSEVRQILPALAKKLQLIAPDRRHVIEQSLKRALRLCDELEMMWKQALAPLRQHGAVMQHPAWRRLLEHFKVPVLAVLEPRHHGSVRPRQLESALKLMRIHADAVLWGSMRHSNQGLAWLSHHADNRSVLRFDALGHCNMTWEKLMRWNIKRIPL